MTNISSKCSIIIFTHNRPQFLRRILDYYSKKKIPFPIIIGDSSSDENKIINKKTIYSLSNLKINYIDKYPSDYHPLDKVSDLINLSKTEYTILCADDDFILPNAIFNCIKFLDKNDDYIAAAGKYIIFIKIPNKKKMIYFPCYINKSKNFPNPISRILFHFSAYSPTFYHVHRTKYLKFIFNKIKKCTKDSIFCELLASVLTVSFGKVKFLNILYGFRDNTFEKSKIKKYDTLTDYFEKGIYFEKFKLFKNFLSTFLSFLFKMSNKNAEYIIDKGILNFRKWQDPKTIKYSENHIRYILSNLGVYSKIFLPDLIYLITEPIISSKFSSLKTRINQGKLRKKLTKDKEFRFLRDHIISHDN